MSNYFRVDRQQLQPNDIIAPEGTYQGRFADVGQQAEAILERVRASAFPLKPVRAEMLFVTDNEAAADQYWRTHDKSYVYRVSVDDAHVLHRGDMNWVDMIGAELRRAQMNAPDEAKMQEHAKEYWQGRETGSPCPEILVRQARVIEQTRELSDLNAYIRKHVSGISSEKPESIEDMLKTEPDKEG